MRIAAGWMALSCVCVLLSGCNGDDEIVYDAYYEASIRPAHFDEFVADNIRPKSSTFFECPEDVQLQLADRWRGASAHCDSVPAEFAFECRSNSYSGMSNFLDAVGAVVRGNTRFENTIPGAAFIQAKAGIGKEQYEEMVRQIVPPFKEVLLCG